MHKRRTTEELNRCTIKKMEQHHQIDISQITPGVFKTLLHLMYYYNEGFSTQEQKRRLNVPSSKNYI
jgi:hypothetical protein